MDKEVKRTLLTSAPSLIRQTAISVLRMPAAICRGVMPHRSVVLTAAPWLARMWMAERAAKRTARCMAV